LTTLWGAGTRQEIAVLLLLQCGRPEPAAKRCGDRKEYGRGGDGRRRGREPHRPASPSRSVLSSRGISPRRWPAAANEPRRPATRDGDAHRPPVTVAELPSLHGARGDQAASGVKAEAETCRPGSLVVWTPSGVTRSKPNCLLAWPPTCTQLLASLGIPHGLTASAGTRS
jgi:hypothetical protein